MRKNTQKKNQGFIVSEGFLFRFFEVKKFFFLKTFVVYWRRSKRNTFFAFFLIFYFAVDGEIAFCLLSSIVFRP